jgi:hypothetical protein
MRNTVRSSHAKRPISPLLAVRRQSMENVKCVSRSLLYSLEEVFIVSWRPQVAHFVASWKVLFTEKSFGMEIEG